MLLPTMVAAQKPHTIPKDLNWDPSGFVKPADTTTTAQVDAEEMWWKVYDAEVFQTNWFRGSEYMNLRFVMRDTIVSQDNAITFTFRSGSKYYDATSGTWKIDDGSVSDDITLTYTDLDSGLINITGNYTIGTGPWHQVEWKGTSAANDSTIIRFIYDGYDVGR